MSVYVMRVLWGQFEGDLENSRLSLPSATNPYIHPLGTFETEIATRNAKQALARRDTER